MSGFPNSLTAYSLSTCILWDATDKGPFRGVGMMCGTCLKIVLNHDGLGFRAAVRCAGAAGKNCFLCAMCKDDGELEKWNNTTA